MPCFIFCKKMSWLLTCTDRWRRWQWCLRSWKGLAGKVRRLILAPHHIYLDGGKFIFIFLWNFDKNVLCGKTPSYASVLLLPFQVTILPRWLTSVVPVSISRSPSDQLVPFRWKEASSSDCLLPTDLFCADAFQSWMSSRKKSELLHWKQPALTLLRRAPVAQLSSNHQPRCHLSKWGWSHSLQKNIWIFLMALIFIHSFTPLFITVRWSRNWTGLR